MMKGDVLMFNRNSGYNKPFMGVSPAHMAGPMGPGANVMGTFKGKIKPGYAPTGVSPAAMGPSPYGPMGVSPAGMGPSPYGPMGVSPAAMGPTPYGPMGVSPAGIGPSPYGPMGVSPAGVGPTPFAPTPFSPTNVLPTSVAPTQVSPTQEFVNTNLMNTVVPHVHPSHTTTVNKQVFTHKHYFPHTQSVVNQCCSQHLVCPGPGPITAPFNPCCPPRPYGF